MSEERTTIELLQDAVGLLQDNSTFIDDDRDRGRSIQCKECSSKVWIDNSQSSKEFVHEANCKMQTTITALAAYIRIEQSLQSKDD